VFTLGDQQSVKPITTLPEQLDIRRKTQVALVTGCIRQAQVFVFKVVFPFGIQYALKAVYVKKLTKTIAYGTYNLSILDGTGGVYQNTTEHLHVDASVKHFYQTIVRQTCV